MKIISILIAIAILFECYQSFRLPFVVNQQLRWKRKASTIKRFDFVPERELISGGFDDVIDFSRYLTDEEYDSLDTEEKIDERFPEFKVLDKFFCPTPPKNANKFVLDSIDRLLRALERVERFEENYKLTESRFQKWNEQRQAAIARGMNESMLAPPPPLPEYQPVDYKKIFPDVYLGPINETRGREFEALQRQKELNQTLGKPHFNQLDKQTAIQKWHRHTNDTGSPEAQIAMAHERIQQITAHLLVNKHDYTAKRSLEAFVNLRRKQLNFLYRTNPKLVMEMVDKMGIRYQIPGQELERSVRYAMFKNTKRQFAKQDYDTFLKMAELKERKTAKATENRAKREKARKERAVGQERRRMASRSGSGGGDSA